MLKSLRFGVVSLLAWSSWPAVAGNDGLGKQLADLRSEVDELEAKLERIRMETRSERLSLETQRGDLEVLLRTEKVRRDTLVKLRHKLRAEQEEAAHWAEELREPGLAAAEELRRYIATSLPYQLEGRLQACDQIISDLKTPDIDPILSISKLWQLTEDELRLTAESGLHKQAITLAGERQLAEVARIGMAVLYFRIDDDQFGWAKESSNGYSFELFSEQRRQKAVAELYEALRKQIRQGAFALPLPKPTTSRDS
jgi:hypothetical protein